MLKISVNQLDIKGIKLTGSLSPKALSLKSDKLVSYKKEVKYELKACIVNTGVLVTGMLKTVVTCSCGRCLEDFEKNLEIEVCHYYENASDTEIDLTPELCEDILIGLPQNYICGDDCKGLCTVCGENRNKAECGCSKNVPGSEAWNALDQIKL